MTTTPEQRDAIRAGRTGGKKASVLDAELAARRDEQPIVTLCGFCEWRFAGTALEGRGAARDHRELEHPEATTRRTPRRRTSLIRPDVKMTDDEYELARRSRQEREDAERLATIERGRLRAAG